MGVAVAVVLTAAGCGFSASFEGTGYRCDDSFRCPDGQLCVEGFCEQSMDVTDAGDDDGGEPADVCTEGEVVAREEFDDLDDDVWWPWSNGDAEVFASQGELVISSAVEANAGIISAEPLDLTHLMVSVEVGARSSGGVGSLAGLQVMEAVEGTTVLTIERGDDTLRAMVWPYDADGELLAEMSYDAEAHRFWRITTTDTIATFQYSSDEVEWMDMASRSISDLPQEIKPQVQSGSYGDVGQDQAFDLLTVCRVP